MISEEEEVFGVDKNKKAVESVSVSVEGRDMAIDSQSIWNDERGHLERTLESLVLESLQELE